MTSLHPEFVVTKVRSVTDNLEEVVRHVENIDLNQQLDAEKRRRRIDIVKQKQYKELLEESKFDFFFLDLFSWV